MSVLIDLIASLEKQLFEADSEAKTAISAFHKWNEIEEKKVFSVFENPKSTEADKKRARLKFDDEEMQKRVQEVDPLFKKRDQIQQNLSEKVEWLRKGYEVLDPTISSQAPSQETTTTPSQESTTRPSQEPSQEPTTRPSQAPAPSQTEPKIFKDFKDLKKQKDDLKNIAKDPTKSRKEKEDALKGIADKAQEIVSGVSKITSPSGESGDDGKSGFPGKSYMPAGSNLKGGKGEKGKKGKAAKKKDKSKDK